MKNQDNYTFFGARKVAQSVKTQLVDSLFSGVAGNYDLMNDLMSGGIHRLWKDDFCKLLDNPNAKLLDVAGGTCDITKRFFKFSKRSGSNPDITVFDLNIDMLSLGADKLTNEAILGVNFVNGSAENLPFADETFDYYTVSFGIRNFTDIMAALKEAKRVLKKGGKFLCLEFSKPENMILNKMYDVYSKFVIPNLGSAFGDREAYEYLVESIKKFPSQDEFAKMIKESGFLDVAYRNLSGGIVAIHTGYKK